jgi:hypothetical protein
VSEASDSEARLSDHPRFGTPPRRVTGKTIGFRNATVDDAEYILSLRLDPGKNAYLSPPPADLEAQRQYMLQPRDGFYFIIEAEGRPIGTVRLYDQRGTSFSWGSWILRDHPKSAAVESALMVYRLGLACGFTASHFEVRRANESVWRFHERMGAVRVAEIERDIFYTLSKDAMLAAFERYGDRSRADIEW